jgi:cation transport ATPase
VTRVKVIPLTSHIRDAEALERMEKVDRLVVDKTGTLTEGLPKVVTVQPVEGFDAGNVLQKLVSVERASEHRLAAAIVAARSSASLRLRLRPTSTRPLGMGVVGVVDGARIVCGSGQFLAENGIEVAMLATAAGGR